MTKKLSNEQKVFNKSYRFIVKQGKPSMDEFGLCRNQDEWGRRCAVACLLNREELRSVGQRIDAAVVAATTKYGVSVGFLSEIQSAHDESAKDLEIMEAEFVGMFKERMKKIADSFGLSVPEVK